METQVKKVLAFSSIDELFEATKDSQLTAQQVINGRARIHGNWQDFELTSEAKNEFISKVVELLGGHRKTRENISITLMFARPQHWGLSRVFLSKYKDSAPRWSYCAGQDYVGELNTIRKALVITK